VSRTTAEAITVRRMRLPSCGQSIVSS
jgi:hypothetical protein